MTPDQAVAAVQQNLGFRSDQASAIITELNNARVRAENDPTLQWPWFLRADYSFSLTTVGVQTLALPSDLLWLDEESEFYWYDSTNTDQPYTELSKEMLGDLRTTLPGSGPPQAVSVVNNLVYVFPIPDAAYQITKVLYRRGTVITAGGPETEWLLNAPDLLVGDAGVVLASAMGNANAVQYFKDLRTNGHASILGRITQYEWQGERQAMGGED